MPDPGPGLASVLGRLSDESLRLAQLVLRTEIALQNVLSALSELPDESAADLQHLDILRQSFEDFSRLLRICENVVTQEATASVLPVHLLRESCRSDLVGKLLGQQEGSHSSGPTGFDPFRPR